MPDERFNIVNFERPAAVILNLIVGLQLVSQYSHTPSWLVSYIILVMLYSTVLKRTGKLFSPPASRFIVVLISLLVFFLYYRVNFTVDMAASFLLLASSLKLLEMKRKKDYVLFSYIMLYLSAVSFLFEQSFVHSLLQLLLIVLCFYLLLTLNGGGNLGLLSSQWRALAKIMIYAIPLVTICFLFFPRLEPLWSIPIKTQHGTTGMSDSMSPGDIAELSQSSERAFRVSFSDDIPVPAKRYWRGLVLDHFDGRTWRRSTKKYGYGLAQKVDPGVFFGADEDSYEVMLEPHNQRWVFALEGSGISSTNLIEGDMGLFNLKTEAIQPTHYKFQVNSKRSEGLNYKRITTAVELESKNRRYSLSNLDLQVPFSTNVRTQQYVKSLLAEHADPISFVQSLMLRFQQKPYFYTLKPPVLGANFVDEFMFDSMRGFCAHYAGSLAYMLRLAKIPARVVIGYQGGELNQQGNYLIVHQYDAHAWVEAKLPNLGWIRLDPTAMVAPERIIHGLERAVSQENTFLENSPIASIALKIGAFNWMRLRADELNYNWQKWIVNYNSGEQGALISELFGRWFNKGSMPNVATIFALSFVIVICIMSWYLFRLAIPSRYSKAAKAYIAWVYLLRRFGLVRQANETPRAFLRRVEASSYPRLAKITRKRTIAVEEAEYH